MTPTIVHRYAFPVREAVEALLGDAAGDCEAWHIRIEGNEVVVDVVAPVQCESRKSSNIGTVSTSAASIAPTINEVASLASNEPAKSDTKDPEPELKGGPVARRAAICCGERGFWTFLGVSTADDAKADVCRRCGITTRKMLDHDDHAAAIWEDIDGKYRLWLEGHDVELD